MADILIVDDEKDIRALIEGILRDEGYAPRSCANAQDTYVAFKERTPDLVILDIWLQNSAQDGLEILKNLRQENPLVPVLMISGHGTIETAVSAIQYGAYDFIEKPFKAERLLLLIERALETARLRRENNSLRQHNKRPDALHGTCNATHILRQMIERVAITNSRVLVTGEQGAGKDIVARMIHRLSRRADKSFVALNCATMHPDRLESELFGTASSTENLTNKGILEQAHEGTLFLDEVSDMPLQTQAKIVRVLQEQRFSPVGSTRLVDVDLRVIASTNRNLEHMIRENRFRQDLFYRLNVVPIPVPPLRERTQDIPILATLFIEDFARRSDMGIRPLSDQALAILQTYHWPGNVRQLRNAIEWVMIMMPSLSEQPDLKILPEHLPPEICQPAQQSENHGMPDSLFTLPLREAREAFERHYLSIQMSRFNGNISNTARFIGMERSAFHRKIKLLDMPTPPREDSQTPQHEPASPAPDPRDLYRETGT